MLPNYVEGSRDTDLFKDLQDKEGKGCSAIDRKTSSLHYSCGAQDFLNPSVGCLVPSGRWSIPGGNHAPGAAQEAATSMGMLEAEGDPHQQNCKEAKSWSSSIFSTVSNQH